MRLFQSSKSPKLSLFWFLLAEVRLQCCVFMEGPDCCDVVPSRCQDEDLALSAPLSPHIIFASGFTLGVCDNISVIYQDDPSVLFRIS